MPYSHNIVTLVLSPQVTSPPGGFYYCQPLLTSSTQLIRSNIVPLQPQSFYQDRGIRPCLVDEFQNSTTPFCAQLGVTLGPDQIIEPAPTIMIIETVQTINASLEVMPTQSGLLVIEKTPAPSNTLSGSTDPSSSVDASTAEDNSDTDRGIPESDTRALPASTTEDNSDTDRGIPESDTRALPGLIAGVILVVLFVIVCTVVFSILVALARSRTHQRRKFHITNANRYLESPERFDGKPSQNGVMT